MKKAKVTATGSEILPEYDFSKGIRGKHAKRFAAGTNLVALSPEVAKAFPDSQSVNEALRLLMKIADRKTPKGHRARV